MGQAETRSQELHPGLPYGQQGAKELEPSHSVPSLSLSTKAGPEPGLSPRQVNAAPGPAPNLQP